MIQELQQDIFVYAKIDGGYVRTLIAEADNREKQAEAVNFIRSIIAVHPNVSFIWEHVSDEKVYRFLQGIIRASGIDPSRFLYQGYFFHNPETDQSSILTEK